MNSYMLTNSQPKRNGQISRNSQPRLSQEEINYDRWITRSEMESVIKALSAKKCPGQDSYIGEFY